MTTPYTIGIFYHFTYFVTSSPPTYDCDVITLNPAHTITYKNILLLLLLLCYLQYHFKILSIFFTKKILCMCCCCCCCSFVVVVVIMDPSHHQVITMDPSHRHGSKSPPRHHHGSKSSSWIQVTINSPAYHIHTIHIKNIQEKKFKKKIFQIFYKCRNFQTFCHFIDFYLWYWTWNKLLSLSCCCYCCCCSSSSFQYIVVLLLLLLLFGHPCCSLSWSIMDQDGVVTPFRAPLL